MQFEDSIKEYNGEQIFCRHLKPETGQDPTCLVFVIHGMAEHIGRYEGVFKLFSNQGMYVFGNDHVGHGRSSGYRAWVENIDHLCIFVKMHLEETIARFPGKKIFIYAHSMGGLISLALLLNYPHILVTGLILEGPFLGIPKCVPEWVFKIGTFLGRYRFLRAIPTQRINSALVYRDSNWAKHFDDDPLVYHGFISTSFSTASLDAQNKVFANVTTLQLPILITHGDEDQITPISGSESLFQKIGSKDKTFEAFKGGYHVLRYQSYNAVQEAFLKLVRDWINDRC